MTRALGVAGLLTALASWAAAQPVDDSPAVDEPVGDSTEESLISGSEVIVVTATRRDQPAFETARSVDVVTAEALGERQSRSTPEALKESPGVFVQETNRGSGAPIIRGLIGPQNLLLVDGLRFNTSVFRTGPNQYLASLDPFAFDRIEVVRGPSSALYGNGAMGGAVNLLTPAPDFDSHRRVVGSLWAQSADYARGARAEFNDSAGPAGFAGGVSVAELGRLRGGDGHRQVLSGYQSASWRLQGVLVAEKDWELRSLYMGTAIRDAGRTDSLGQGDVRLYDNDDHFAYLQGVWRPGERVPEVTVAAVFHRTDETVNRTSCATDADSMVLDLDECAMLEGPGITRRRRYEDKVNVFGVDLGAESRFLDERLRVRVGGEGYLEGVGSSLLDGRADDGFVLTAAERGNFSDGSTYTTLGAFSRVDATVLKLDDDAGRVVASGGARVSNFRARAPDVPDLGEVEYSHTGVVGSAGLQFLYRDAANLYGTFAQGFRAPNLQETTVLADTGSKFEVPNADLGPERSDTVEVGAKARVRGLTASAAAFVSLLDDVIDEEPAEFNGMTEVDGKPVIRRVNAASGRYIGTEASAQYEMGSVTVTASAAWIRGRVEDGMGETRPARRVPPLFGTAGVRHDFVEGIAFAEGFVQWAAPQDRLHPSDRKDLRICETSRHSGALETDCDGTPGWATLNARGGIYLGDTWSFYLAALNVTDARYRLHGSGFEAAGIDIRATVSAQW